MISLKSTTGWPKKYFYSFQAIYLVLLTLQQHGVRPLVPDPPDTAEVRFISSKPAADMSASRVFLTYKSVRRDRSETELVVTHLQENFQPVDGA